MMMDDEPWYSFSYQHAALMDRRLQNTSLTTITCLKLSCAFRSTEFKTYMTQTFYI